MEKEFISSGSLTIEALIIRIDNLQIGSPSGRCGLELYSQDPL